MHEPLQRSKVKLSTFKSGFLLASYLSDKFTPLSLILTNRIHGFESAAEYVVNDEVMYAVGFYSHLYTVLSLHSDCAGTETHCSSTGACGLHRWPGLSASYTGCGHRHRLRSWTLPLVTCVNADSHLVFPRDASLHS